MGLDLKSLLGILGGLGQGAGALGIPFAGLVGDLAVIAQKYVAQAAAQTGQSEQEIIAAALQGADANAAELLKDQARLAAEKGDTQPLD